MAVHLRKCPWLWAVFLLAPVLTRAGEPVLARLCLWVPATQMAGFEAAYQERIAPVLKQHGLVESPQHGRPTVDSVFSRLFEVSGLDEIAAGEKALRQDSLWQAALRSVGVARWRWGVYAMPAGPGRTVEAGPGFRQGLWQSFGAQDGLPSPSVLTVLQDHTGNLWFGTVGGGVSRYDGTRFTTFTTADGLASNTVRCMAEDREGNLWFGTTGGGVSRYDGMRFTTFTDADGLADSTVFAMAEDREGHLWFGTAGGGVSRYDGTRFTTFTTADGLANMYVISILQDREGNLWFGTMGGGVSRYDGAHFVTLTCADGLADSLVVSMAQDRRGDLWFGTWGGVSRYDGKEFTTFTPKDGLTGYIIQDILEDQDGNLWFGGDIGGVTRYDGQRFTPFTVQDGLVNNQVNSILEDRDGQLWFGCFGGVSRYDGARFSTFTTENGLANNGVMNLLEDRKGTLWVGSWGGVSRYDGKKMAVVTDQSVRSMVEDRQGDLWFAGDGVTRYDGEKFTHFSQKDGLAPVDVWSVAEDREGQLWFGGRFGRENLSRYDGTRFTTIASKDGLAASAVWAILKDRKGDLWFGTQEGLRRYDGHQFTSLTRDNGLVDNVVKCLLEDRKGYLWIGTEQGVSRYDGKEFLNFTTAEGLAANSVISMLEDRDGHLWFGTFGGGLSQYDGLVFQGLSRKDGLPNDAVQEILQGHNGDIWIGTEGGVVRYRPSHTPPAIRVVDVSADRQYGPAAQIQVSTLQDYLRFEFEGTSLGTPRERMAYVYRLVGYDETWKPTHEGQMEYNDLPIGEYLFEVKAVDRDLNYSAEPARVRVQVHPPYGRIGWLAALGLSLAVIAWQAVRIARRDHRLQRANQEVERATQAKSAFLASMSHELRTPMNAILGFTELLQANREKNLGERQLRNLSTIQRNARGLLGLIDQLLDLSRIEAGRVEILPEDFDLREVVQESLVTVEPLVQGKPIALGTTGVEEGLALCTDRAKLRQILVNLLSNAVKFTAAGRVEVKVSTTDTQVRIAVADTGVGIPADKLELIFEEFVQVDQAADQAKGAGLGLAITRQLVLLLGGRVEVESTPGQGSTFAVVLPRRFAPAAPEEGTR